MPSELVEATREDAERIRAMLGPYLTELAVYAVGEADGPHDYPYLDAYWSEPDRHAFTIRAAPGDFQGFVLVRAPGSTGTGRYELAEFYLSPPYRRSGIGTRIVQAVWRRFPGPWELQVDRRNSAAVAFWSATTGAFAAADPTTTELAGRGAGRLLVHFDIASSDRLIP